MLTDEECVDLCEKKVLDKGLGWVFCRIGRKRSRCPGKGEMGWGVFAYMVHKEECFPCSVWVVRTCGIEQFRLKYILKN